MNQYFILKPKNLNIESLVNKYKPNFDLKIDYVYLIVYLVILFGNKKNNDKQVCLSSKFLEKLIGKNYNKYIDFLLENYPVSGNILNGYRYSEGKPFSYKLTDYYYESGFELYSITDNKLVNRVINVFKKSINENIRTHYYYLMKYFNNKKLTFFNPFEAILKTNDLVPEKRLKNALNLIDFLNGEHKLTLKTKTDGRVHSNLTRLSKQSRDYLQYDGEFLAEIDISSSVPYFLYLTMNYYLNNNLTYLNEFQYSNSIPHTYMFDEVTEDIDKLELQQFGDSVLTGRLYEQISELIFSQIFYESKGKDFNKVIKYYQHEFKLMFGYYFDGDMDDLKKFSKRRILAMIFANTSLYKFEQLVFKELFPSVLKFINEYKDVQQYKDCEDIIWSKKESHKKISYFCFQFEAKVMIDNIARDFDKLHKGKAPVFTIHDCILTTSSYADELREFMKSRFVQLFGVAPNLTLKYSEFNNAYRNVS